MRIRHRDASTESASSETLTEPMWPRHWVPQRTRGSFVRNVLPVLERSPPSYLSRRVPIQRYGEHSGGE
jgi:hypothetical protein